LLDTINKLLYHFTRRMCNISLLLAYYISHRSAKAAGRLACS